MRVEGNGISVEEVAQCIQNAMLGTTPFLVLLGSHLREDFQKAANGAFILPERQAHANLHLMR